MGNCCSAPGTENEVNIQGKLRAHHGLQEGMEHILDEREILGLKGADKL